MQKCETHGLTYKDHSVCPKCHDENALVCEDCGYFKGRNKYCGKGLWIEDGDNRICSYHTNYPKSP